MRPPLFGTLPFSALTADQKATTPYVIFDIDNCLADDGWRIPLIDWTKQDIDERYDAYHRAGRLDASPHSLMVQQWAQTHIPIFLTARPLKYREDTVWWIEHVLGIFCYILITRNNNDNRPSVQLKGDMVVSLHEYGLSHLGKIDHAYDDREDVCAMYVERFGFNVTRLAIHNICAMTPPSLAAPFTIGKFNAEQLGHVLWADGEEGRPKEICDRNGQVTLGLCKNCGRGESQLFEGICPALRLPPTQRLEVTVDASMLQQAIADAKRELCETAMARFESPTAQLLYEMAGTFAERNAVYKDNYKTAGAVLAALYDNGVDLKLTTVRDFEVAHLLWLIVVKLTRFVRSQQNHADSMVDIGVYSAMIAAILKEKSE